MKVTMKVQVGGTRDGATWPAIGEVLTVSDREGAELCAQGYAEAVAEPERARATKATAPKPEKRG